MYFCRMCSRYCSWYFCCSWFARQVTLHPLLICLSLDFCCSLHAPPSPIPISFGCHFRLLSLNLARCLHFWVTSVRLLRYCGFCMFLIMWIFSAVHSPQNLAPFLYGWALSSISHLISGSCPKFLSHICCDKVVAFLLVSCLNENVCAWYLFLNFSVLPIYFFGCLSVVVAW